MTWVQHMANAFGAATLFFLLTGKVGIFHTEESINTSVPPQLQNTVLFLSLSLQLEQKTIFNTWFSWSNLKSRERMEITP